MADIRLIPLDHVTFLFYFAILAGQCLMVRILFGVIGKPDAIGICLLWPKKWHIDEYKWITNQVWHTCTFPFLVFKIHSDITQVIATIKYNLTGKHHSHDTNNKIIKIQRNERKSEEWIDGEHWKLFQHLLSMSMVHFLVYNLFTDVKLMVIGWWYDITWCIN